MGDWGLVRLCLDVVQAEAPDLPRAGDPVADGQSPRMMLTLMTYCYAATIYASEEIRTACDRCPPVRYISARQDPNEAAIRHFRRANRSRIRRCLARILTQAQGIRVATSQRSPPLATDMGSAFRFESLAEQRIQMAVLMDMATGD